MSILLKWRKEWSLDIEILDKDHQDLVEKLGVIYQRFSTETSAPADARASDLIQALSELGEAMRDHFQREEAFMRAFGYEDVGEHHSEHAILMAEYTTMLREWREEGVSVIDDRIHQIVRHWLLAHILGADRAFAEAYFRVCGSAGVGRSPSADEIESG